MAAAVAAAVAAAAAAAVAVAVAVAVPTLATQSSSSSMRSTCGYPEEAHSPTLEEEHATLAAELRRVSFLGNEQWASGSAPR